MTDNTFEALSSGLADAPVRSVLADWLEEQGRTAEAGLCRSEQYLRVVDGTIRVAVYTLRLSDGVSDTEIEYDEEPTAEECDAEADDWCRGGDWGQDGASIDIDWTLTGPDGEEIDDGGVTVEIEPDHAALIRSACGGRHTGQWERCCGDDPDSHDWTSEGEGGCDSNPGVWSTGGTSMLFRDHCRTCGLRRTHRSTGSQRNPGEHDTTEYEMPDDWCGECEREECSCPKWYVIDQTPDEDGEAVVYGEDLTRAEAEEMVAEIEADDDGREPLLCDQLP